MSKNVVKIGIFDDDSNKISYIKSFLSIEYKSESKERNEKYSNFEFNIIELELNNNKDEVLESIIDNSIDFIIIDYSLSDNPDINYTGVDLANFIDDNMNDFPLAILTSYEDDLYDKDIFSPFKVFSYKRYMEEESERNEFIYKIIEEVLQYKRKLSSWAEELESLYLKKGQSVDIDSRILELDDKIEKSLLGKNSLSKEAKKQLMSSQMDDFLKNINDILKGLQENE